MKQNILPAKFCPSLIILVVIAIVLSGSACVTIPQATQSAQKLSLNSPPGTQGPLININTASARELEQLPGVGPSVAERIVAHRQQYGAFRRAEHLMMVRGISDRKFRELRAMIIVE